MIAKLPKQSITTIARMLRLKQVDTDTVIERFLMDINSPRSLTVWLLYKYLEHDQLVDLKCVPENYNSSQNFFDAYIPTEYLSKASFLSLNTDPKVNARDKFLAAEVTCGHTNIFLKSLLGGHTCVARRDEVLIKSARRKIARILGDVDGDELFDVSGWGPGVTTLLKGSDVSAYNKFHREDGITQNLYPLCHQFFPLAYPRWSEDLATRNGSALFRPVEGNVIVTVPKNAKSERVIAIEPGINLWIQKGYGTLIRRKLRRIGINLNSQQINQSLARKGSIDNSLATIDFSSASDTIAKELVRLLLPQRWFIALSEARCQSGVINGSAFEWEKFSSMGNGFTFELESLIFVALALASCEEAGASKTDVHVYGDDVIIPVEAVDAFRRITELLGFSFNGKKSFSSTPFRESCGAHWYDGVCIKPIYFKDRLSTIESLFSMANKIRRLAHRRLGGIACDKRFIESWRTVFLLAPRSLRSLRISEGYGDGGFIGNFDEATPARLRYQIEGYSCLALRDQVLTRPADGVALLLRSLRYGTDLVRGNSFDQRGRTIRRTFRLIVPQWYYLGPWV